MSAKDVMSDATQSLTPCITEMESKEQEVPKDSVDLHEESQVEHNLPKALEMLQQSLVHLDDVPILRLNAIRIQGLKQTRHSFLASVCRPYADPSAQEAWLAAWRYGHRVHYPLPGQPTTIFEIIQSATSLSSDISKMDIVKEISVQLEPAQHPVQNAAEEVDVVLRIQPASRFFLKTSTSIGNSEGTAIVQGKMRNLFGGAESLEGSATWGTRTKHSYNVRRSMLTPACLHHTRVCFS